MRHLSDSELIHTWERGAVQHPVDRAVTLLALGYPDESREALAATPVGRRDAALLSLWEVNFGPRLRGFAVCPRCDARLQLELEAAELRAPPGPSEEVIVSFGAGGRTFRLRLPDSRDLAAAARCANVDEARRLLIARAVLDEGQSAGEGLGEQAERAIEACLSRCDPQADVQLNLHCVACSHHWPVTFEIATFLWKEVSVRAQRLLYEVHSLARAYGWSEADVLALSPARRQAYLNWVNDLD